MDKRILDDATKKALRGYLPFSINCTTDLSLNEIVPEQYRLRISAEFIPTFTVRPFTQSESSQIRKNAYSIPENATSEQYRTIADLNLQIVRNCVTGWKNLFDVGTGEEIIYRADPSGGCDKDIFALLPEFIGVGLMKEIRKISGLSTVEALGLK